MKLLTVAVLLSVLAMPAFAERGHHWRHVMDHLDLTSDQQTSMSSLAESAKPKRETFRASRNKVHDMIKLGQVDQAAEQAAALARQHVYELAKRRAEMASILTPDQMNKLDEMRSARKGRGGYGPHH